MRPKCFFAPKGTLISRGYSLFTRVLVYASVPLTGVRNTIALQELLAREAADRRRKNDEAARAYRRNKTLPRAFFAKPPRPGKAA